MSGFLAGAVWRSSLPPELKSAAAMLSDFARDDGTVVVPSVKTMAARLGRTERSVQRYLARLLELGVIVVETPRIGGRVDAGDVVRIHVDGMPQPSAG